jgi:hypothetical protein
MIETQPLSAAPAQAPIRAIKSRCKVGQDRAAEVKDHLTALIEGRLSVPGETIEATA